MPKVGMSQPGLPEKPVDSEYVGVLAREGYELTPRADEAEILVVNTCGIY